MAVQHFPDGVKIGPDTELSSEDDRLPLYDFDEWVENIPEFTLAAGAQTTLVVQNISTLRLGSTCLARPSNPNQPSYNFDKLVIKHVYCATANEMSILVKNDSGSSVTYGEDQWVLTYFSTSAP